MPSEKVCQSNVVNEVANASATPTAFTPELRKLALDIQDVGCVKFGAFTLKSGSVSPVYFDLRLVVSHPRLMRAVATQLWRLATTFEGEIPDLVCGVPYTALPIATCIAVDENLPMVVVRKEAKDYGTKRMVEGVWTMDQSCLIIEDVIVTGSSLAQTARNLRQENLRADLAVVLLDRNQGAAANLKATSNITVKSLFNLVDLTELLLTERRITQEQASKVHLYLQQMKTTPMDSSNSIQPKQLTMSAFCPDVNERLAALAKVKKSRLCVAMDLYSSQQKCGLPIPVGARELLAAVNKVGSTVCAIKLHLDTLTGCLDSTGIDLAQELRKLAEQHGFLIIEDRKLADIGQTVLAQMTHGAWSLADWCDLVTVHALPGPGLFCALQKLKKAKIALGQSYPSCLVVAEMSTEGSLTDQSYKQKCLDVARQFPDVVAGFVCQHPFMGLKDTLRPSYWVPGVRLDGINGDQLGQSYQTPKHVLGRFPAKLREDSENMSELTICIVGRGITEAVDLTEAAKRYQLAINEAVDG